MLDVTDVHFRALCRLLSRRTELWTEMVVDQAVVHAPPSRLSGLLWSPALQQPLVLQLGGCDPARLAAASAVAARRFGATALNLNCGCPSPRVAGSGGFGAALMTSPEVVARACAAMADASGLPVSVKCRTGVDDVDSYEALCGFVDAVSERGGVSHFVVHARKARRGVAGALLAAVAPPSARD